MKKNRFEFYEIVRISSNRPVLKKVNGLTGFISGVAQNEETGLWSYAVSVYADEGYLWSVNEDEQISTGMKENSENHKPVETVKIHVDPKTGEGYLVDDEE